MNISKNNIYQGSRERKSLYDTFYIADGNPKPVLIFSHGFKGFKDHGCFDLMAEYWAEKGFAFVKFNFSYNGGSIDEPIDFPDLEAFSENNYTTELNDLGIIIDNVVSGNFIPLHEIDTAKLYLMGHSRGGGITILKGIQDERVKKFVSLGAVSTLYRFPIQKGPVDFWKEAGVTYIENARTRQNMPLKYQFYENYLENKDLLDIESQLKDLDKSYLNIHGEADETVPVKEAYDIKSWSPEVQLEVLPGVLHSFGSAHPWTKEELPEDFKKAMNLVYEFLK